ncbi:hypothetical protein [Cytobacillus pseudoceanisediminis]|uniref:hypothetical protein n=1 Tax=Cytobacillus pseudoceanisediminis TaxID=3051614 RepID=UPI003CEE4970
MIPTPHKIEILKAGDLNVWGEPSVAETIQVNGNIRTQSRVVKNNQGEEVVSSYTVLFVGFVDITSNDKIRFTEPNGEVVEIAPITVKFMRDLDGSVGFTKAVL